MSELKQIKNKFTAAMHGTDDLVFREFTYQGFHDKLQSFSMNEARLFLW
ncbi:hypothetical protein [Shouchella clausii]|jgi:hypothetical protein|nr:hypothetical protein [Shouchella clausii]SPT78590.1 spore germination protein KA [Niallia circulans]MBU8596788.1 hypothetical protein [Shouchella clausii]MCM3550996.1 hypothetical protein [Shouchella clausii]MCY1104186.1 hypothetical protein [Shouchella clausii]MEB5478428.1 hypothetical protein [Shouchella clausii]